MPAYAACRGAVVRVPALVVRVDGRGRREWGREGARLWGRGVVVEAAAVAVAVEVTAPVRAFFRGGAADAELLVPPPVKMCGEDEVLVGGDSRE